MCMCSRCGVVFDGRQPNLVLTSSDDEVSQDGSTHQHWTNDLALFCNIRKMEFASAAFGYILPEESNNRSHPRCLKFTDETKRWPRASTPLQCSGHKRGAGFAPSEGRMDFRSGLMGGMAVQ
jgi:hypothetical protein